MKKIFLFIVLLNGFNSFSQVAEQQNKKKTPELKLATEPKEGNSEKNQN
jgi:hypothetical protein